MQLAAKIFEAADLEAATELCFENKWTDGLPVIPPTRGAVERIIHYLKRDPAEVIGVIQPRDGVATIETIAINCVMAGCKPEYVPIVIAAIEAMIDDSFNLNGVQTTTHGCAPLTIISGPAVKRLGFNTKECAFGHGDRATATIGRAIRLILWNIGGGFPGEPCKTTQGHPGYYSFCIAEDADTNLWEPLQVEYGYQADDTVVTIAAVEGPRLIGNGAGYGPASDVLTVLADSIATLGSPQISGGDMVLVLAPMAVKNLHDAGYSKADVQQKLWEWSKMQAGRMTPEDMGRAQASRTAAYGPINADTLLTIAHTPQDIAIIVAGGAGAHTVYIPCFGNTRSVTRAIA